MGMDRSIITNGEEESERNEDKDGDDDADDDNDSDNDNNKKTVNLNGATTKNQQYRIMAYVACSMSFKFYRRWNVSARLRSSLHTVCMYSFLEK